MSEPMNSRYWADDPTQRGDQIAEEMRAYYEEHRPPTLLERIFGKQTRDDCAADNLMAGLLNIVLCAEWEYAEQRRLNP